ncbi:MAG TPA: AsmA family protein [Blastocatellia bacterium]|jgi:uncharacterized protein involved in outer membrane biogenesis|nr:AsmA family protein [Blastocatellia bacterium]
MARRRGRLLRLLFILILLLGGAALVVPLIPLSPLKRPVELRLSRAFGRDVTVDSVRLSFIPSPHLSLSDMTVHEDPQFGEGSVLKAEHAHADLNIMQFVRTRRIAVESLELKSPQITLVKNSSGAWNWTTLGSQAPARSSVSAVLSTVITRSFTSLSTLISPGDVPDAAFKKLRIENADVKLVDHTSQKKESLYKDITLDVALSPDAEVSTARKIKGELKVNSEENAGGEPFITTLPLDIRIDSSDGSLLSVTGSVGPGAIEARNVSIGAFTITGDLHAAKGTPFTATGQMSIEQMTLRPINLSERVAGAFKLDQIGDMRPGTEINRIDTDFEIEQGVVRTPGVRIQQLDGLGDATAENGSFKIESALSLDYSATVMLSPEATARVKSISTTLGILVTVLETNNRLSVPLNISGDVRKPEIQVDVSRIL